MPSRHDCESKFGSTSESGCQRWHTAQPAFGPAAASRAAPHVCAPATSAATTGAEPTPASDASRGTSAPDGQPAAAPTKAQPPARTEHQPSARVAQRSPALGTATRPDPQAVRWLTVAAAPEPHS